MKIKYNFIYYLPIILFLLFPETSIKTSLALDKKTCHSIYLCKVYLGLGVADWIMVGMASILILNILKCGRIILYKRSLLKNLFIIYFAYLIIGMIYNNLVYFHLQSYLYDLKIILYFLVIYYWLFLFSKNIWSSKHIFFYFVIYAIGSIWDYIFVYNNFGLSGFNERSNLLNFVPQILPLFINSLLLISFFCFKKHQFKILFFLIINFLFIFNLANLGAIYSSVAVLVFVFIYKFKKYISYNLFFLFVVISYLILNVILPLIMYELLPYITDIKSTGLDIRKMKTLSVLDNYFINIPIILGKGLGSTYFVTHFSEYSNVYSEGIYHTDNTVGFIIHSPLGVFYKLGFIGTFLMMFFLFRASINLINLHNEKKNYFIKFISLSYPIFVLPGLIYPGSIKDTVLISIIILITDKILNNKNKISIEDKKNY